MNRLLGLPVVGILNSEWCNNSDTITREYCRPLYNQIRTFLFIVNVHKARSKAMIGSLLSKHVKKPGIQKITSLGYWKAIIHPFATNGSIQSAI